MEKSVDQSGGGTIHLVRRPGLRDRARLYAVVVDGESVASLREGEARDIGLAPGTHAVWIKIDWTRSRKMRLDLVEGERVTIQRKAGGGPMMSLIDAILRSRRYIEIQQGPAESGDESVGLNEQSSAGIPGKLISRIALVPIAVALVGLPVMLVLNVPAWAAATVTGLVVFIGSGVVTA